MGEEDTAAVGRGVVNLLRHVRNMQGFGLPVVVALNRFSSDTDAEIAVVAQAMAEIGVEMALCTHWSDGAAGAAALAGMVQRHVDAKSSRFAPIYPDAMALEEKLRVVARRIYHAADIALVPSAAKKLRAWEAAGFGHLPICVAKTPYSFSADPTVPGAPSGHILPVRDVRLSAGAGFIVAICGDIMTMPGLPRVPAAEAIRLDAAGLVQGLF
jgi:formate--tetrahydrofolate ligase